MRKDTPATVHLRQVAPWRLPRSQQDDDAPQPSIFTREDSRYIYPPLPGILPAYALDLTDDYEREHVLEWMKTLTPKDQAVIQRQLDAVP